MKLLKFVHWLLTPNCPLTNIQSVVIWHMDQPYILHIDIRAVKNAPIAIPLNTITNISEFLIERAVIYVMVTAMSPHVNAETCVINGIPTNKIAKAAPKPAPEDTPSISGDTGGF